MTENEMLLVEAVKSMFDQTAELGLKDHDLEAVNSIEHSSEYLHSHIDNTFHLYTADLVHATGINAAFSKVHSYKYIDDPKFKTALEKDMVAQGIPKHEREKAVGFVTKIVKELNSSQKIWAEKDIGFNSELKDIMSLPDQDTEFKTIDSPLNKGNMKKPKKGNASPGKMGVEE